METPERGSIGDLVRYSYLNSKKSDLLSANILC